MDGFIFVDKDKNMTSRNVCNEVGKLFKSKKVGHNGTLDPFATGLLIVSVNKGNKASTFLDDFVKEYEASLFLGEKTSTGDIEGEIIDTKDVKDFSLQEIKEVLSTFLGESQQLPPMTSAIKINGVKLYKLAHKGIEIEREKRKIFVHEISLISYHDHLLKFKVKVSKGTYIRSLGEDIAEKLGTIGHLKELRRIGVGPFKIDEAVKLSDLKEENIISIYDVLSRFCCVKEVNEKEKIDIKNGKIKYLDINCYSYRLLIVDSYKEVIAIYEKENDKYVFKRGLF